MIRRKMETGFRETMTATRSARFGCPKHALRFPAGSLPVAASRCFGLSADEPRLPQLWPAPRPSPPAAGFTAIFNNSGILTIFVIPVRPRISWKKRQISLEQNCGRPGREYRRT